MGVHADAAAALLARWHGPGLGAVTGINDPRANPVDGLVAATGSIWPTPVGPPQSRVVTVDAEGRLTVVGPEGCGSKFARWSPDGATLAFTTDRGQRGIHQVAFASRDELAAAVDGPTVPGTIEMLAWSPDGAALLAVVAGYGAEIAGAMASGRVPVRAGSERVGDGARIRRRSTCRRVAAAVGAHTRRRGALCHPRRPERVGGRLVRHRRVRGGGERPARGRRVVRGAVQPARRSQRG
jgi:dipeptidyl aminopeptidase/acylaminoacyl peptidase